MRILFASPRLCAPQLTGARIREYYLMRALGERAEVTYVSFVPPGMEAIPPAGLPFCRETIMVPLEGKYSAGKLMRGLLGRWPLPVLNHTSAAMKAALAGAVSRTRFDLVHLDSENLAACEPFLYSIGGGRLRVVYDWHNIVSESMHRYAATSASLPRKAYAKATARRLETMEAGMLRTAFGHAVCSDRERELLLRTAPDARVVTIENGVDTASFAGAGDSEKRNRILFVGSMDYQPNSEAVTGFVRNSWPGIVGRFPQWRFTIAGSNPGPEVTELSKARNVEVTGTVPDVRPYYREAFAAVVPLRTGSGTRLKILEAMAAGVPVLSTSLGAEGLAAKHGREILIVNGEGWGEELAMLAGQPERWRSLAEAGRELVCSRHDWRTIGARLYEHYREWLETETHTAAG